MRELRGTVTIGFGVLERSTHFSSLKSFQSIKRNRQAARKVTVVDRLVP